MNSDFYFAESNNHDNPQWFRVMHHSFIGAAEVIELDFLRDPFIANTLAYRMNVGL